MSGAPPLCPAPDRGRFPSRASPRTAPGDDVQLGKLAVPRCAVMPCEKNRGVARDTVRRRGPRESGESRPVVTVLVTRLPRRSKYELGRSLAIADRAMDPTPLWSPGTGPCTTRVRTRGLSHGRRAAMSMERLSRHSPSGTPDARPPTGRGLRVTPLHRAPRQTCDARLSIAWPPDRARLRRLGLARRHMGESGHHYARSGGRRPDRPVNDALSQTDLPGPRRRRADPDAGPPPRRRARPPA